MAMVVGMLVSIVVVIALQVVSYRTPTITQGRHWEEAFCLDQAGVNVVI